MFPDMLEDFVSTSDQWTYGLSGTMTLFNGFANINEYKAARAHRSASFLAREQAALTLMLEVVSAHLALQTAAEQETLARRISDVAVKRFTETQDQWREGLVNASALLDAMSEREKARVQAISARFQYQVTTATLLNVMGQTQIDYEEPEHDGAS
jgi:outer membrane protein TolC